MPLTFPMATSRASVMGTVGRVEGTVDTGQEGQEEPQQQVHGIIGKAGASANWEEEENKPI